MLPVVEMDALETFIKKNPRTNRATGEWQGKLTRIWTAGGRNAGDLFAFEVGDDTLSPYLKMAFRIEKQYIIEHLCTDGNRVYRCYKFANQHHVSKSETCLVESWHGRLRHYLARLHRKTLCYSKSIEALKTAVRLLLNKEIALSVFV